MSYRRLVQREPKEDGSDAPGTEAATDAADHATEGIVRQACTDGFCLLIFFVFLGCQGWIALLGYRDGNLDKLTRGLDWKGQLCGVDANVSNEPFLYWCGNGTMYDFELGDDLGALAHVRIPRSLNLEMPICVGRCPRTSEELVYCPTATDVYTEVIGVPPEVKTVTTMVQETVGQAAYPTTTAGGRLCLPDVEDLSGPAGAALEDLNDRIHEWIDASWALKLANMAGNLANDIPNILPLLCGICAGAFAQSFLYLLLLRHIAKPLVYATLLLLALAFGLLGSAFVSTAHDLTGNQSISPIFEYVTDHTWAVVISDVLGGLCLLLAVLIAGFMCCMQETIEMVCGCIEAAVECMFDMPTLLLEPVVGAALKLALLLCLTVGLAHLVSMGQVEGGSVTVGSTTVYGVARTFSFTDDQRNYILFYVFGMFWLMEVCDACQQFVVSYAVVLWYYKPIVGDDKKSPYFPVLRGFFNALFFHLGTLAFGSLLVATTQMLRLLLAFVKRQAEVSGNRAGACLASCCLCCMTCFERFLEYVNKNAYIDVAIHSTNFLPAAYHVFQFIRTEVPAIAVLDGACWIAQLGGVLCTSFASGFGTYTLITQVDRWSNVASERHVTEPVLLAVLAGLLGFCISAVFMWVFDQCSDTLLYIFADNRKRNPETVHTYAPPTLANLVDKFEDEHRNKHLARPPKA